MQFNKLTKMAILPAAAAGVALSGWALADASASHASVPATSNHALTQAARRAGSKGGGTADAKAAKSQQNAQNAAKQARAKRAARRQAQHWVTVKSGESLSAIAAAHHMTWQAIYATPPNYKHLPDPNHLRAGQRLRLPDDPKMRAAEFSKKFEAVQRRMQAAAHRTSPSTPAARNTGSTGTSSAPSGGSITAGMSAFEACVAYRESGDNPTDPDGLFGILPSTWASLGYSGMAGQASVAVQEQAFNKLYAQYGTSPWAPYDGC
ncbi:MAG TPA: LysM peptidoglycan-binding domain-containing protein [Streptosporangiaceae bacterium]